MEGQGVTMDVNEQKDLVVQKLQEEILDLEEQREELDDKSLPTYLISRKIAEKKEELQRISKL
jgi:hypothetical protein